MQYCILRSYLIISLHTHTHPQKLTKCDETCVHYFDLGSWAIKKELILSNCGAGEDSWDSVGWQGNKTSRS